MSLIGPRPLLVAYLPRYNEFQRHRHELCNNQVHYIPVPMKRGVGLDGLSAINKLTKIFRENKFDIIQYSTPNAALYASIAAKRAGCANRLYCQWGIRYEVEKYYSAMDVFCSLSYREGFGLVVIEAAAMGLPGIVTDVPGQEDTIEPNVDGWFVPAKNVDKVISTIEHCIDNPEEIRNYGYNARRHVEERYEQNELFNKLTEHRDSLCKTRR